MPISLPGPSRDDRRAGTAHTRPRTVRADHHLLLAFEGPSPRRATLDLVAEGAVPGVTLFRYANVESAAQVGELTTRLEAANPSDLPLLVAADQETGQLMGLGDDTTPFPGAMALGAVGDADLAERVAFAVATEARAMGVTVVYAPVCDLATRSANPSSGTRAFSDDPRLAADLVAATVAGHARAGVAAVAKHFPGQGEAETDPHHELPLLDLDRERLDEVELVPFRSAIAAGASAVMVGHYAVPVLTGASDLPTSVSGDVIDGLLRDELGFDGVVVTDALDMAALAQGTGQVIDAIAAVRAGVDLLLTTPEADAGQRIRAGLDLAASRGLLPPPAATRRRVERLRRWLAPTIAPSLDVVGCAEHRRLAEEVARRSVTLVRDDAGLLPLRGDGALVAVMPRPENLTPADTSATVQPSLAAALRRHHGEVHEIVTSHRPDAGEIAAVVQAGRDAAAVVVGTLAAGPEQARLVEALLAERFPTVTVAMRTPFDLASYPGAGTHLCTYSILGPSMEALAAVLFGAAPVSGRLPAAIAGAHPAGHGLTRG